MISTSESSGVTGCPGTTLTAETMPLIGAVSRMDGGGSPGCRLSITATSAPFSIARVDVRAHAQHAPRHAAADHRAMARRHADAAEREDRFLEVGLLGFDRFDA